MTLDLAGFRARGPEFAAVSDGRVAAALVDAEALTDLNAFLDSRDRAVFLHAAHILASSPSGREAAVPRTRNSLGAKASSGAITDSVYLRELERLTGLCCAGYGRVPDVNTPEAL